MKKNLLFFTVAGLLMLGMNACKPQNTPVEPGGNDSTEVTPPDTTGGFVAKEFPRKHLIEEFTGQSCGYCPYGMDCISEFMQNDTNWVLILHHYGYSPDNFSVNGSRTITSTLGVNSAPSMAIDRAQTRSGAGNTIIFHPGYLPETDKSQFETKTYASIELQNTYDAASRELKGHVSGQIGKEDFPLNLKLTVLVKESGMIDTQADYYNTFNGWQEFRHANAVRGFLTNEKGFLLDVDEKYTYHEDFSMTLSDQWVAENCMVVAFLTEDFKPVVQVAEKPVVNGSKGGADIKHGGVKEVPVSDYYPEPNATDGPSTYSKEKGETLPVAVGFYTPYANYGFTFWTIQAYNQNKVVDVNGTQCVPFAMIYLFTDLNVSELPLGTYEFNTSEKPGSAYAGYRDDEQHVVDGSEFYFTSLAYLQQGYLQPVVEWLIADGTLTIEADGWKVVGHARNGANINLKGTSAIQNGGRQNAPQKKPAQYVNRPLWQIAPRMIRK